MATQEIIYQERSYVDEVYGWTDWQTASGSWLETIREDIKCGKHRQLKGLTQISLEGYQVPEQTKKECSNKVNGICPLHNLFCAYPDCEND